MIVLVLAVLLGGPFPAYAPAPVARLLARCGPLLVDGGGRSIRKSSSSLNTRSTSGVVVSASSKRFPLCVAVLAE